MDVVPIEQEYNFDEIQNHMKEILIDKNKLDQENANKFVDDLVLNSPSQIKKIVDKYIGYKSPIEVAGLLLDEFYKKTFVNSNNDSIENLAIGTEDVPDSLEGDRGLNTMESKILNFKDFKETQK